MRSISTQALEDALAEDGDEVWLILATISHPSLASTLYLVNNNENITSRGIPFTACPFDIEFPENGPDKPGTARLSVDNVDREIVLALRRISTAPTVKVEVILASTPNLVEVAFDEMTLRGVTWDVNAVDGSLEFESVSVEPISEMITPERFPGLF